MDNIFITSIPTHSLTKWAILYTYIYAYTSLYWNFSELLLYLKTPRHTKIYEGYIVGITGVGWFNQYMESNNLFENQCL